MGFEPAIQAIVCFSIFAKGDIVLDKKQKKALAMALTGVMSFGITGGFVNVADAAVVETEDAQSAAAVPTIPAAPADKTAQEAPESVYKVLIDGTKDEALISSIKPFITTKDGQVFNATSVQSDIDAIQSSGLVQKAVARTIQSNGNLYVVYSVTPLDDGEIQTADGSDSVQSQRPAAGQTFEPVPEKIEDVAKPSDDKQDAEKAKAEAKKEKKATEKAAKEAAKQAELAAKNENNIVNRVQKILDEYHATVDEKRGDSAETVTRPAAATVVKPESKPAQADAIIEDIEYTGNTKTKDWVIDKIVSKYVHKGDKIDTDKLQALYSELYSTRYFKNLDVKLKQGSAPNAGIVEIVMQDDKTGEWSFGLGASTQNKAQVIGSVKDYNLGGAAQTIGLDFGLGTKRSNGEFYYTNPYLGKSDTSLNFSVFANEKDDEWRDYDYTEKRAGASLTLAKPVSEDKSTKLYGGLSFSHITTDENWIEDLDTTQVFLGISQVKVDDVLNTRSGYGWDIGASSSVKSLGSDYDFTKLHASVKGYTPAGSRGVLAARLRYDYSNKELPFLEQFTLGGTDSVRGLDEDELRGDKAFLGTVEYRHTLNDWLQAVAFVDFGKTWVDNSVDDEGEFKVSPGLGLRAVTKMGVLRFDAAKTSGHDMKFVFGIGQSF